MFCIRNFTYRLGTYEKLWLPLKTREVDLWKIRAPGLSKKSQYKKKTNEILVRENAFRVARFQLAQSGSLDYVREISSPKSGDVILYVIMGLEVLLSKLGGKLCGS